MSLTRSRSDGRWPATSGQSDHSGFDFAPPPPMDRSVSVSARLSMLPRYNSTPLAMNDCFPIENAWVPSASVPRNHHIDAIPFDIDDYVEQRCQDLESSEVQNLPASSDSYTWGLQYLTPSPLSPHTPALSPCSTALSRDSSAASWSMIPQSSDMTRMHSTFSQYSAFSADGSEISFEDIQPSSSQKSHLHSQQSFSLPESVEASSTPTVFGQNYFRSYQHQKMSSQFCKSSELSPHHHHDMQQSVSKHSTTRSISSSSASTAPSNTPPVATPPEPVQQTKTYTILPKQTDASTQQTGQMVRVQSSDGTTKVCGVIPRKHQSSPPSQRKLTCKHCNVRPEGFRGEHELQRHINRAHTVKRKMWICKDGSEDGNFLNKCKFCMSQKRYGAYYNAAAHLRRTHFNPRKRGRRAKTDSEKRGGKAGGNWPPMEVLKDKWLVEVEEIVTSDAEAVLVDNNEPEVDRPEGEVDASTEECEEDESQEDVEEQSQEVETWSSTPIVTTAEPVLSQNDTAAFWDMNQLLAGADGMLSSWDVNQVQEHGSWSGYVDPVRFGF